MLKTLTHPDEPKLVFKMGRKKPVAPRYGLRLGLFVEPSKIQLPDHTNYAAKAMPCLDQMLLNATLGCCTASGAFHIEGVLQGNAGHPQQKFSNAQVEAFYSATTGYKPGHPETDQGGDENTVLDYWRAHGLYKNGHKIAGHATVDATNWDLVRTAVYLFGNTYLGMSLPDAWVSPPPAQSGWTWDVAGAPDESNGHCVAGIDYEPNALHISSWGMLGRLTREAAAKYCTYANGGEMHTVFSYDMIDKASQRASNGFRADELWAAFRQQFPESATA